MESISAAMKEEYRQREFKFFRELSTRTLWVGEGEERGWGWRYCGFEPQALASCLISSHLRIEPCRPSGVRTAPTRFGQVTHDPSPIVFRLSLTVFGRYSIATQARQSMEELTCGLQETGRRTSGTT